MSEKPNQSITPSGGGGFFEGLTVSIKLVLRLLADSRVNPLLKLLPIGTLVYLVVPDVVVGPIDDAAIIWLGTYLFVELCPPDVVNEHRQALSGIVPPAQPDPLDKEEEIVDAEYWEEK